MWEFFIRNNRFGLFFIIALIGVGSFSVFSIARESTPEVQIPVGIITTVLLGAPAADIETLVTNEIEKTLSGSLENVKKITSVSRESVSTVVVEFNAEADIDESISDLKDKVDAVIPDLPEDSEDPFVSELNFIDEPIMTIAISDDRSDSVMAQISNELEDEIEGLPSISRVTIDGVRKREVTIVANQQNLERFDVSLSHITSALQSSNQTFPIGQIENDGIAYNIAFEGDIENISEIQDIRIATIGGQSVFIRDVAVVIDGLSSSNSFVRLSDAGLPSENALSLSVFKQRGGDITKIAISVNERLEALQKKGELLEGMSVVTVLDAGKDIEKDLTQLSRSGMQTVMLVILILIVVIGWREALIAGTAIPLSFLFGFIGLYFSGNTINFLSLFALILGIGVLVDSGIVMVEGINRKMKDSPDIDKKEAAIETIREFKTPLISGTLTTVSMFAGLFVVSGVTGQFIEVIPFTIVFVLLSSLFVALGILPLIASMFLRRKNESKLERLQVSYAHKIEHWYRLKLNNIIGNRRKEKRFIWLIRLLLLIALFLPVTGVVKVVFFEQSDIPFIYAEIELPEGSIKEETDIAVRRVEEVLYTQSDISSFLTTVGSGSAFGSGGTNEKLANIFISLKEERVLNSTEIVEELQKKASNIQDAKVTISQPNEGPPVGAPVSVKFLGDDLVVMSELANQAADILKEIEGTKNVRTSTHNNSTEFVLTLEKVKAASVGLTPQSISLFVRTAVYGTTATSLLVDSEDIDVVVKLNIGNAQEIFSDETNKATIDDISRLNIPTAFGTYVPLSSVVDISLRESRTVINHEDGERVVTLSSNLTSTGNARDIQTGLMQKIKSELIVPKGVSVVPGGETGESNKSFIEMFIALIVGIVLMLGILVLQFNSFLHTRYVLSILPYSLIGIMFGLAITQNALSFPSIMGFIALSGIVVNNSILLIDMMNQQRRKNPEKSVREVVIDSSVKRLRPILLTTMTTVVGMIPLIFVGDLWAPLAYAVMFGLLFSVVITLILIPVTYSRKPGKIT